MVVSENAFLMFRTVAVDSENCDPMNLYRWPEGAHVKNLEIVPRLLCTGLFCVVCWCVFAFSDHHSGTL